MPSINGLLLAVGLAAIFAAIGQFVVLPRAGSFDMLTIAMAAFFLPAGVLAASPATQKLASLPIFTSVLLALEESYSADFADWANDTSAALFGIAAAAAVSALVVPSGAALSLRRRLRAGWADLALAARSATTPERLRLVGLFLDRMGQLAPQMAMAAPGDQTASVAAMTELRIGVNLVDLNALRDAMPPALRAAVDAVLRRSAAYFAGCAAHGGATAAPQALLQATDGALGSACAAICSPMRRRTGRPWLRTRRSWPRPVRKVWHDRRDRRLQRVRADVAGLQRGRAGGACRLAPGDDADRRLSAAVARPPRQPLPVRHHPGGRHRRFSTVDVMKQSHMVRARSLLRVVVTLVIVATAFVAGRELWSYYEEAPWTRDGRVRADVVTVAPDVQGLVDEVLVQDNQRVKRGDVLFRIDSARFRLALEQADAMLANRKAQVDEAAREAARYQSLTDASVSLQQRQQKEAALQEAVADYRQAVADRAVAGLNLTRSEVTSPVDGTVTNVALEPGDYVTVGRGVMALIDSATLRVEGYFEETKLPRIHVGDRVQVRLMGETQALTGHVVSIAAGIADRERSDSPDLLASVNPTFSWVRLAQRVPVRVKLDAVPANVDLVLGRTATVAVIAAGGQS